MSGSVTAIHITSSEGGETHAVDTAQLELGKGIVGDRYHGTHPDDQITLVDEDALAQVNAATGWQLTAAQTRRNVVTRGIDLNQFEQGTLRVGGALLLGVELCEPCASLGALLENSERSAADVVRALTGKAGLRARIIESATIAVGDAVVDAVPSAEYLEFAATTLARALMRAGPDGDGLQQAWIEDVQQIWMKRYLHDDLSETFRELWERYTRKSDDPHETGLRELSLDERRQAVVDLAQLHAAVAARSNA